VFFILHVYLQYGGLLDNLVVVTAFAKIIAGMTIGYIAFYFFFRLHDKTAVSVSTLTVVYLLFGNIKIALENIAFLNFVSHYRVLLPLIALGVVLLLFLIRRSRNIGKLVLYLNILLLICSGLEIIRLFKWSRQKSGAISEIHNWQMNDITGTPGPNVYYIVFDCYPSPLYQREVLGRESGTLDSFLNSKQFHIIKDPSSNYNSTVFSMASTLQMNYVSWLKAGTPLTAFDYTLAMQKIKHAAVVDLFRKKGYMFHNLSIFDWPSHPSIKPEKFLSTTGDEAIFYFTLWNCLKRDLIDGLSARGDKTETSVLKDRKDLLGPIRDYNEKVMDSLTRIPGQMKDLGNVFVYAHVGMPHFPYFLDSTGNSYPDSLVYGDSMITSRKRFREYIAYTDQRIIDLVEKLFAVKRPADIIILQSDHGIADLDWNRKTDAFRNYSAFYFPDKTRYAALYPGMSNVNTFRVIFNAYFGQQLPLLIDSTSFVK
jgi:hypothetical protein